MKSLLLQPPTVKFSPLSESFTVFAGSQPLTINRELGPNVANILIVVTPPDAVVEVDNKPLEGRSPFKVLIPLLEPRILKVTRVNYQPLIRPLGPYQEPRGYEEKVILDPIPASLMITTQVPDVDITIDDISRGKSPLKIELPPGKHTLVLNKEGYHSRTEEVSVGPGEKPVLPPYTLSEITLDEQAKIREDNDETAQKKKHDKVIADEEDKRLAAGKYGFARIGLRFGYSLSYTPSLIAHLNSVISTQGTGGTAMSSTNLDGALSLPLGEAGTTLLGTSYLTGAGKANSLTSGGLTPVGATVVEPYVSFLFALKHPFGGFGPLGYSSASNYQSPLVPFKLMELPIVMWQPVMIPPLIVVSPQARDRVAAKSIVLLALLLCHSLSPLPWESNSFLKALLPSISLRLTITQLISVVT